MRPRLTSNVAVHREEREVRRLRDRGDDGVGRDDELGPGIGTGERRPEASGSPSLLRMNRTPVSLPSSPMSSMGLTRNSRRTPSRSVSPSSSSSTTGSDRVRRYAIVTFSAP